MSDKINKSYNPKDLGNTGARNAAHWSDKLFPSGLVHHNEKLDSFRTVPQSRDKIRQSTVDGAKALTEPTDYAYTRDQLAEKLSKKMENEQNQVERRRNKFLHSIRSWFSQKDDNYENGVAQDEEMRKIADYIIKSYEPGEPGKSNEAFLSSDKLDKLANDLRNYLLKSFLRVCIDYENNPSGDFSKDLKHTKQCFQDFTSYLENQEDPKLEARLNAKILLQKYIDVAKANAQQKQEWFFVGNYNAIKGYYLNRDNFQTEICDNLNKELNKAAENAENALNEGQTVEKFRAAAQELSKRELELRKVALAISNLYEISEFYQRIVSQESSDNRTSESSYLCSEKFPSELRQYILQDLQEMDTKAEDALKQSENVENLLAVAKELEHRKKEIFKIINDIRYLQAVKRLISDIDQLKQKIYNDIFIEKKVKEEEIIITYSEEIINEEINENMANNTFDLIMKESAKEAFLKDHATKVAALAMLTCQKEIDDKNEKYHTNVLSKLKIVFNSAGIENYIQALIEAFKIKNYKNFGQMNCRETKEYIADLSKQVNKLNNSSDQFKKSVIDYPERAKRKRLKEASSNEQDREPTTSNWSSIDWDPAADL